MNAESEADENPAGAHFETVRIRHGASAVIPRETPWWVKERFLHDERLADTCARSKDAIAVLQSAVLLHGGSVKRTPHQAHVWTPWRRKPLKCSGPSSFSLPKGQRRERLAERPVVNHRMEIDTERLTVIDGILVTDLMQTMEMSARLLPPDDAFIALESLLAIAAGRDEDWRLRRAEVERRAVSVLDSLMHSLRPLRGRRGIRQARQILDSISPLSESPLESEAKRLAHAAGYLDLSSQVEVRTPLGVKWIDLGIPGVSRGLEINGDLKYEGEGGGLRREREEIRRQALKDARFRIVDLPAHAVFDAGTVLRALEECFPEHRRLHGRRHLWTPLEAKRFCP